MNFRTDPHRYFNLMTRFAEGKLSALRFVAKFMELWRKDRNADYEIKKSWNAPHDEMLIASLQKGKITRAEFKTKWNALWGLSERDRLTRELLDKVFTACDVFNPDAASREDYEYSEDALRTFVTKILPAKTSTTVATE